MKVKKVINFFILFGLGVSITGCIQSSKPMQNNSKKNVKVDSEWKKFSESYSSRDYSLRDGLDYFELRKYVLNTETRKLASPKYIPYFPIYRKELASYSSKTISQFQKLPYDDEQETNIAEMTTQNSRHKFKVKGFIIKKDKTFLKINEKKDFIWLFDKIDTEAELYWFLEINNLLKDVKAYKRTTSGYEVKQENIESKSNKETIKNCIIYSPYQVYTTYVFKIQENGTFSKKLISTKKKNLETSKWCDGLHPHPAPLPPYSMGLDVELKHMLLNPEFVTP